jgi:two-component system sensor histidine kinase RegB
MLTQNNTIDLVSHDAIRLRWLIRIRWAALVSLAIIFLGANYLLNLGLYSGIIIEILGLGFISNTLLVFIARHRPDFPDLISGLTLVFDVLLLTGLLLVSGGYTNPFCMVFLAYVTLAAVVLDARWTWGIFAVSLLCFIALFFLHIPLPSLATDGKHTMHVERSGFSVHLHGMLLAFLFLGIIIAAFVTRMNREIFYQAQEISKLRQEEQEQKSLVSLATLTAGVTHELATPLATLSLIGEDLARELRSDPRWGEDVEVLQEQLGRCSAILQRMRDTSSELQGEAPCSFSLGGLMFELQSIFADSPTPISFDTESVQRSTGDDVVLYSLRHALYGSLQALIRNAVQACSSGGSVTCKVSEDGEKAHFVISDTGAGMSKDIQARVGEPFFTSKAPGDGMGLGIYLTKLYARQVGGSFNIESALGEGSQVSLVVPLRMGI